MTIHFKGLFTIFLLIAFLDSPIAVADTPTAPTAPQASTCIVATFSNTGNEYWSNINIKLTNNCGKSVSLQNSTFTFTSSKPLNTSFWGTFGSVAYPDNNLQITSQPTSNNVYTASLTLHFPEESWANNQLANGQSITLSYGSDNGDYNPSSAKFYISGAQPVQVGQLSLSNTTPQPNKVAQAYAVINVVSNGTTISSSQVPWGGQMQVAGLAPGAYTLQPVNVSDSGDTSYQGTANPSQVTVVAGQSANATISYQAIVKQGSLKIQMPATPALLQGYGTSPTIVLTRKDTGASTSTAASWNGVTSVSQLANNVAYTVSTSVINYNGATCTPAISPASVISSSTAPPTASVTYDCIPAKEATITLNVSGLPDTTTTVTAKLTPNNASTPVNTTIDVASGAGTKTVKLLDGVIYNISFADVTGYSATIKPQPLTASSNAAVTATFQKASGGRIIGYLPGWKTPPSAQALKNAGYTHILVAFGVFGSTPANAGQIVSAFDTVTKEYITSLKALGIKVILSLGGASSSIPGTTASFKESLDAAKSPADFQATMTASIKSIITQYGFDGIDIDIENGFGPGPGGTLTNPGGEIAIMAAIINQLHTDNPNLLITLAPQTANVAATNGFSATWGNYASLIMKTYQSLTWVGIQLYNTGCTNGIDNICYAPGDVNYSVIMAVDLLENWPSKSASGQATGFLPYISYLRPDQVVLGYPSKNKQGVSDGAPPANTPDVKKATSCLRNGPSDPGCGSYKPPKAYPGIGGVFNWEVTYDQDNDFKFATELKDCVINGNCS